MHVGTYPTRNFATLGPSNLLLILRKDIHPRFWNGPGYFYPALQVALQIGLYHLRLFIRTKFGV